MSRRLLAPLAAALLIAPAAHAADPGRWRLADAVQTPIDYFQGLTHGPQGVFFVGPSKGAYRTDRALKEAARVDDVYPPDVEAIGFNHVGDPTYDPSEGGRLLAPMECYHPELPQANTCGMGGFGVLDPQTLQWRYWVRLDQADIPKAMWAEISPDGRLVWTSSGNDLLAYATADITQAHAATGADAPPIHPVRRLAGAVPPSGVTGAVFVAGRLLLAGDVNGDLQIRSVDLTGRTPARLEAELPGVKAESEGLDLLDMRGGTLHWLLSPFVAGPTYGTGHTELLTFLPAADARLHVKAVRSGPGAVVTVTTVYGGRVHPVAGAEVRIAGKKVTTTAAGRARLARVARGAVRIRASKLALIPATVTLPRR